MVLGLSQLSQAHEHAVPSRIVQPPSLVLHHPPNNHFRTHCVIRRALSRVQLLPFHRALLLVFLWSLVCLVVMGGASKGRVAKKQRPAKSSPRVPEPTLSRRPMRRRGLTTLTRLHSSSRNDVNLQAIDIMFNQFRDKNEDKIGPEGMQALLDALDVNPEDIAALIFAWKLKAKVPFEFSRSEFCNGCVVLKSDSMEKLKKAVPTLRDAIAATTDFRSFYMYAFEYNKPPENRSLPIETARQLFPLILGGRFIHLDLWMEFLKDRKLAISKDSYCLLLDFVLTIDEDMSNFDEENGAWPVLLDEFVEFARPKIQERMLMRQ